MSRILILSLLALLGGCTLIHKQDIQQGNVLDREDLERLETGMTKRQVLVLLGSPALVNPFHEDRWDYINSYAPRGGPAAQLTLTVRFQEDRVVSYEGSYLTANEITGSDLEELNIIDPNTNQPVLPESDLGPGEG